MSEAQQKIIVMRADGGAERGLGHLYRSAALADMLRERFTVVLAYREAPSSVISQLQGHFSSVARLPNAGPGPFAAWILSFTVAAEVIIVLDGYHFGPDFQQELMRIGARVVAIDDIHAHHFAADLVINHAPIPGLAEQYDLSPHTTFAGGLAYSLLRRPYLAAAREKMLDLETGSFFICFGGSDHQNVSSRLIRSLTDLGCRRPLEVILGAANEHLKEVEAAAATYQGEVVIHQNLNDQEMIRAYRRAELAFLPASTTLIEAMATGVKTVTGHYVDNQRGIYAGIQSLALSEGVGDWNDPQDISGAIERAGAAHHNAIARQYIDGYSNVNLLQLFDQLAAGQRPLAVRPAEPGDVLTYFKWANDASVRANALRTAAIPLDDHRRWFAGRLRDENALLLHFTLGKTPCGQLRYEWGNDGVATIDISLDATYRGQGLGLRFLELGEQQLSARNPLVKICAATVKAGNPASAKIFERAGFFPEGTGEEGGVKLLYFQKNLST